MASIAVEARFWDRLARKYAANPIADMAGWERSLERACAHLNATDTVFEFGCGSGGTTRKLAPSVAHITATDISKEMIAVARERAKTEPCANATFEVGAPDDERWRDGAFDAVIAFNVIHLIPNRNSVLRNIRGMLKPGGHFISKTPCLSNMNPIARIGLWIAAGTLRLFGRAPTLAQFSAKQLEREIEAAGFRIVERGFHATKAGDIRPFLVALRT